MSYGMSVNNWLESAYISGEITAEQYIETCTSYKPKKCLIEVVDGVVWVWPKTSKTKPWERMAGDPRDTKEYKEWRTSVFKRDKYTCRSCGSSDHDLNAHHIKKYHDYPKLRFKVSNGLTLCKQCHLKAHKTSDKAAKGEVSRRG